MGSFSIVPIGTYAASTNFHQPRDTTPGFEVDLYLSARLRDMIYIWRGDLSLSLALETSRLEALGPSRLRRALPALAYPAPARTRQVTARTRAAGPCSWFGNGPVGRHRSGV